MCYIFHLTFENFENLIFKIDKKINNYKTAIKLLYNLDKREYATRDRLTGQQHCPLKRSRSSLNYRRIRSLNRVSASRRDKLSSVIIGC